jgi:sensor histidine kinase YesM
MKLPLFVPMKRQIIKATFVTSLVLSFLVVAPIYIIKKGIQSNFLTLWALICLVTLLSWFINYLLLNRIKKQWIRFAISLVILFIFFRVFLYYFRFTEIYLNFNDWTISFARFLIILSINLAVNFYLNLIVLKEKQLILNNNIADLKYANLEANYKLLKDQINPHFIFNSFSTLKSLIKRDPDAAQQYILILADFMRSSIDFNNKSITLIEELKLCENYIALQKFSYGAAIQYSTNILEQHYNEELPYFAIVSLLENATKHNSFSVQKTLNIKIFSHENYIVVQNNKQPRVVIYSDKTGLKNINERCKIFNGNEIQIIDDDVSFTVKIKL